MPLRRERTDPPRLPLITSEGERLPDGTLAERRVVLSPDDEGYDELYRLCVNSWRAYGDAMPYEKGVDVH